MYQVAARLGMTVEELAGRMSGPELIEWQAFFALERGREIHAPGSAREILGMLPGG